MDRTARGSPAEPSPRTSPLGLPAVRLASRSPRRAELLAQIGVPHVVVDVEVDEAWDGREGPQEYVLRLARAKAAAALQRHGPGAPLLAADTTVVVDGRVFGKPEDRAEGLAMLAALSGRTHQVCTGVAVATAGRLEARLSVTQVTFRALSAAEREAYWASGEPLGKAGGYALQGLAATFVTRIEGSWSGVVGLPLAETAELLARHGAAGVCPPA